MGSLGLGAIAMARLPDHRSNRSLKITRHVWLEAAIFCKPARLSKVAGPFVEEAQDSAWPFLPEVAERLIEKQSL